MNTASPVPKIKATRLKTGLTQKKFWEDFGLSQSCGSRYENGREIPELVSLLIDARYGKSPLKALAKLRGTTIEELVKDGK